MEGTGSYCLLLLGSSHSSGVTGVQPGCQSRCLPPNLLLVLHSNAFWRISCWDPEIELAVFFIYSFSCGEKRKSIVEQQIESKGCWQTSKGWISSKKRAGAFPARHSPRRSAGFRSRLLTLSLSDRVSTSFCCSSSPGTVLPLPHLWKYLPKWKILQRQVAISSHGGSVLLWHYLGRWLWRLCL